MLVWCVPSIPYIPPPVPTEAVSKKLVSLTHTSHTSYIKPFNILKLFIVRSLVLLSAL